MKKANYLELGRKVQFYRNKFNLTQEQLASDIGISQKQISNIERAY